MLRSYGYSDNCQRCAARRAKQPAAGLNHSAPCRIWLEALLLKDRQLAEVVRRRDVRHGLAPPGDPSIAKDLNHPILESVFPGENQQTRTARLRSEYDRVRHEKTTRASGPVEARQENDIEHEGTATEVLAQPMPQRYDPMPEPLGEPEPYGPQDDELDDATPAPEKQSRNEDDEEDDRQSKRRRIMSLNLVMERVQAMGAKATN